MSDRSPSFCRGRRARRRAGGGAVPAWRQRGAVLIMGLVILLALTLLGVQAATSSGAQYRMAANWHERHLAFEAAEAALLAGEQQGPFDPAEVPDELADAASWDGVTDRTGSLPGFHPGLALDPAYHVGPARWVRVGIELPVQWRRVHTVTGRGVGTHPASVVVVQSVYAPPE
ncbi:MAG: PilX N-terminal domain-containing pilus assembly protein [Hydrogenophaga sp.]|uniref:pilus assembly PilX family protein n=1 Tax=Hydrogenophaga sp. TaxID=1904254 RepID=UPI002A36F772|nr:PilX N-terminal domain-containing pilus assembly protein [Hydrogenophaga sp.]MDX9970143.1 PilX N-terminal domain-containing pilus assembly protein [Hydrogenophaga sp.]